MAINDSAGTNEAMVSPACLIHNWKTAMNVFKPLVGIKKYFEYQIQIRAEQRGQRHILLVDMYRSPYTNFPDQTEQLLKPRHTIPIFDSFDFVDPPKLTFPRRTSLYKDVFLTLKKNASM